MMFLRKGERGVAVAATAIFSSYNNSTRCVHRRNTFITAAGVMGGCGAVVQQHFFSCAYHTTTVHDVYTGAIPL